MASLSEIAPGIFFQLKIFCQLEIKKVSGSAEALVKDLGGRCLAIAFGRQSKINYNKANYELYKTNYVDQEWISNALKK